MLQVKYQRCTGVHRQTHNNLQKINNILLCKQVSCAVSCWMQLCDMQCILWIRVHLQLSSGTCPVQSWILEVQLSSSFESVVAISWRDSVHWYRNCYREGSVTCLKLRISVMGHSKVFHSVTLSYWWSYYYRINLEPNLQGSSTHILFGSVHVCVVASKD